VTAGLRLRGEGERPAFLDANDQRRHRFPNRPFTTCPGYFHPVDLHAIAPAPGMALQKRTAQVGQQREANDAAAIDVLSGYGSTFMRQRSSAGQ
jgi:hypothetical protein